MESPQCALLSAFHMNRLSIRIAVGLINVLSGEHTYPGS